MSLQDLSDFDTDKFKLGTLCKRRHEYEGTGKSLRYANQKKACVECQRAHYRKYHEKNKEQRNKYGKKYKEANKERYAMNQRKYREENKERLSEYSKKYCKKRYEENKEYYRELRKKYYEENHEKCRTSDKKWYEKNKDSEQLKEYRKKYGKAWAAANPDKVEKKNEKRRTLIKRQSDGSVTTEKVAQMLENTVECPYCLKAIDFKVQDHMIPVSRGGLHSIYNLAICCSSCNKQKFTKSYPEWLDCLEPEQRKSAEKLYFERYGVSPIQGFLPLIFDDE